jgi:hypothetical protein
MGFQSIWMMLLGILLATFGSLILIKPEGWQTPLSYGMLVGASIMMCNWMLCAAAVTSSASYDSILHGCESGSDAFQLTQCQNNCTSTFGSTTMKDNLAAATSRTLADFSGWSPECILAVTQRAVVCFTVFLFLCYLVDAVMLVVFRKDIMQAKAAPASEEPQAIGANAAAYGQPAANAV